MAGQQTRGSNIGGMHFFYRKTFSHVSDFQFIFKFTSHEIFFAVVDPDRLERSVSKSYVEGYTIFEHAKLCAKPSTFREPISTLYRGSLATMAARKIVKGPSFTLKGIRKISTPFDVDFFPVFKTLS